MINARWRSPASDKSKHYIDKDELTREVQKCIDNNRTASDKLAKMQLEIVEHLMRSSSFADYTEDWKEQMRSYAVYKLMKSMKTVDLSKCRNVFNYYTRAVALAFASAAGKLRRDSMKHKEWEKEELRRLENEEHS